MTSISNTQELNRYTIALGDFQEAIRCLDEVQKHQAGSTAYVALCCYAIILYARPFSKNEQRSDAEAIQRLEIEWFHDLSESDISLHWWLIDRRNKAIAHAEFDFYPTSHDRETGVIGSRRASIYGPEFNISVIRALAEKLATHCLNRRADYTISVRNELGRE